MRQLYIKLIFKTIQLLLFLNAFASCFLVPKIFKGASRLVKKKTLAGGGGGVMLGPNQNQWRRIIQLAHGCGVSRIIPDRDMTWPLSQYEQQITVAM
jgi:hypothetical protein